MDRRYLGRNWSRQGGRRMAGVVFFERRPHHHAHLVVRPPEGTSPLHFLLHARFWFERHPEPSFRRVHPVPVTDRGRMLVQRIGCTHANLARVLSYDAKAIEGCPGAISEWKFISDLTRR